MNDEQINALRKASEVLCGTGYHDEASTINGLLAASASAEPVTAEVRSVLKDLMDDVADYSLSGVFFKTKEIEWRAKLLRRAQAILDATPSAENRPAQDDVRDAQRYRWLRERFTGYDFDWMPSEPDADDGKSVAVFNVGREFRGGRDITAAIDAAIASQSAKDPK